MRNTDVTVTFDPNVCRAAPTYASEVLPGVFDIREKRWGSSRDGAGTEVIGAGRKVSIRTLPFDLGPLQR